MLGDITCAHCGWRNEATARMCGGCGQPLRQQPDSAATLAIPGGWSAPEPGATTPVDVPSPYTAAMAAPAQGGAPSIWPGGASAGQRRVPKAATKKNPWRALITLLVVLCVLLVGTLVAWVLLLRPAIHDTVDSQLRTALDTAIEQAAPANAIIPPGTLITVTLPAAALNADIENELGNVPIHNVQVQFRGAGYVRAGYSFLGRDGTIITQLVPLANGRVQAQNTSVTGLLKLVETSDDMTASFNEALGRLPPQYHVTRISAANDTLSITVTGQ